MAPRPVARFRGGRRNLPVTAPDASGAAAPTTAIEPPTKRRLVGLKSGNDDFSDAGGHDAADEAGGHDTADDWEAQTSFTLV